jgi:hypothetical protein
MYKKTTGAPEQPSRREAVVTTDQDGAIRYASVTAAVDDLRSMLPILRGSLEVMESQGDDRCQQLYRRTKAALQLLEGPDRLRRKLEAARSDDGTVVFRFTPEAAARLEE